LILFFNKWWNIGKVWRRKIEKMRIWADSQGSDSRSEPQHSIHHYFVEDGLGNPSFGIDIADTSEVSAYEAAAAEEKDFNSCSFSEVITISARGAMEERGK
jgi:hypothetical protein